MTATPPKPAFIELADPDAVQQQLTRPGVKNPYDFGFTPAMSRLILTHGEIGALFRPLYAQIMFRPGHLTRPEREMVAGVAAAAQDCFY